MHSAEAPQNLRQKRDVSLGPGKTFAKVFPKGAVRSRKAESRAKVAVSRQLPRREPILPTTIRTGIDERAASRVVCVEPEKRKGDDSVMIARRGMAPARRAHHD